MKKQNIIHKELAAGRWFELSLMEQLANVGSDVIRTINWKKKGDKEYSRQAFYRALELKALAGPQPKAIVPGSRLSANAPLTRVYMKIKEIPLLLYDLYLVLKREIQRTLLDFKTRLSLDGKQEYFSGGE